MSNIFKISRKQAFLEGLRDGVPIALGYFAVSFSLGIFAKKVGVNVIQGIVNSLLNHASAGEYAVYSMIGAGATYVEMAIMTLVVNARYLLMSTALSQKVHPDTPMILPLRIVSAFSVALYGMFLACIMPAARNNRIVAITIICCFVLSYLSTILPVISNISGGTRTIILTVVISAVVAFLFPYPEESDE